MAPLNRNEVVIAAGYSPDLDDYSDRMDIYDMEKAIWYTKPWSRLQQGDSGPEILKKAKKIVKWNESISRIFFFVFIYIWFHEIFFGLNYVKKNSGPLCVKGPRIDASCLALTIGTATQIIISGGWSNLGVQASELLDESTLRWNLVGENSTLGQVSHALPYALRSSSFIELDNVGKYYNKKCIL